MFHLRRGGCRWQQLSVHISLLFHATSSAVSVRRRRRILSVYVCTLAFASRQRPCKSAFCIIIAAFCSPPPPLAAGRWEQAIGRPLHWRETVRECRRTHYIPACSNRSVGGCSGCEITASQHTRRSHSIFDTSEGLQRRTRCILDNCHFLHCSVFFAALLTRCVLKYVLRTTSKLWITSSVVIKFPW